MTSLSENPMSIHEALFSRRTVYSFKGTPVDDTVLERALQAATWAPNHRLTQPWRFLIVGPESREALSEIAFELAMQKAEDCSEEEQVRVSQKAKRKFTKLGGLVIALQALPEFKGEVADDDELFLMQEDYAAVACAVHNFVLSLWADGIAALWGTGGITRNEKALETLGVDVKTEKVVGFLRFGLPEKIPAQKRKPLEEVVRRLP